MQKFHGRCLTFIGLFFTLTVASARAQRDFGVDVSHFQAASGISQAAWNQLYTNGVRFTYIKGSEGLTGPDDAAMATNLVRAAAAGIQVGVYHYAHPENRTNAFGGVQEADHFLAYAGNAIGPGFLRPALDLESSAGTLNTSGLTDWVIAFCNEIIAERGSNAAPVIYCDQSFANSKLDSRLADYALWLRTVNTGVDPSTNNPPAVSPYTNALGSFNNWAFWQYSDMGTSGGISPLDQDVCHSEFKSLASYVMTPPPCDGLPSGLVDWWRGQYNAVDAVGTNSGTLTNGTAFAPGKVGEAFSFDGVDDALVIPDGPTVNFNGSASFTMEAWVSAATLAAGGHEAVWQKQVPGTGGYLLELVHPFGTSQSHLEFTIFDSVKSNLVQTAAITDTNFHHVAAVFNRGSGQLAIYLDGASQQSISAGNTLSLSNTSRLWVGHQTLDASVSSQPFHGLIDDLSIYNRALSASEIQAITNAAGNGKCIPPVITTAPQSLTTTVGSGATFSVASGGMTPLGYQWRFNGTNIAGATATAYTQSGAQLANAGGYSVVVTNPVGSVTSVVATLTVVAPTILYGENFDGYGSPVIVTTPAVTNGFNVLFGAASGAVDFTAKFGFDYSTVTYPIPIPSAPHSTNGTTKGLYLTVNKDATGAAAAVNLYPIGQSFAGTFSLKFDMWINWTNTATSTEDALFGINHSGSITNRVGQLTSDGLFFAMDGDGGASATSTSLRDYSVFKGGGSGIAPILVTSTTSFGPAALLGSQFDNANAGFSSLFPAQTITGYPSTAGSPGLQWVACEVRQQTNLITWLLNDTIVAQYTNTTVYTNGSIMIGYNDNFTSPGDPNNFVIFDNLRVESLNPDLDGNGLADAWEIQYFGHIGVDPNADADGDGVSNLREYLAGTNPTNAASAFHLMSAVRTNNNVLLSWSTVGGHSYVVQVQTNGLTSTFTDLSPVISAGGTGEGTTNYLQEGGATNRASFYRVRLGP